MNQKSLKKPLCPENYVKLKNLLITMAFIYNVRTSSGQLVITTNRRTGFVGFMIYMKNYLEV